MTDNITKIDFNAAFNMEPEEIVDYFKSKGLRTSFDWHEVYADAHAKAFTVAKMTEVDLLKDTQNLLTKALEEGQSYGQFKKEAKKLFEKKGWVGFKEVTDPNTGEKRTVELGTPRRIKTIFDCNMNSAYAAGRYREQIAEIDVAPYWQYMAVMDERTRPEHQALHGRVFKATDNFWNNFYPPNGWGCRCYVRNLTESQLKRKGITPERSVIAEGGVEAKPNEPDYVNARSEHLQSNVNDRAEREQLQDNVGIITTVQQKVGGEIKEIPVYKFNDGGIDRVLKPDAGWENNIGKATVFDDVLMNKIENLPESVKDRFIQEIVERQKTTPEVVKNVYENVLPRMYAKKQGIEKTDYFLLKSYTKDSTPFNEPIRQQLKNNIPMSAKDQKRVEKLENVFEGKKTKQVYKVYRGDGLSLLNNYIKNNNLPITLTSTNKNDIKNAIFALKGKIITQDLFMSSSFRQFKAVDYASHKTGAKILWTINVPKGANAIDIREFSTKPYEYELLFNKGQKLRIHDIDYDEVNNVWKINAELVI